jgi:hypothetical protein
VDLEHGDAHAVTLLAVPARDDLQKPGTDFFLLFTHINNAVDKTSVKQVPADANELAAGRGAAAGC